LVYTFLGHGIGIEKLRDTINESNIDSSVFEKTIKLQKWLYIRKRNEKMEKLYKKVTKNDLNL
jgi:hypothetical protein